MTTNRTEYENIDKKLQPKMDSVYTNPVFDDHNEDNTKLPLLNETLSSSNTIEQSPYEEVAVNVSNTDDPTTLCVTFRSMFIGILLTCLTSFTVQFFSYRTSPLDVNIGIVILLSYIIGQIMAATLPKSLFGLTLNPGPFSVKEHAIIAIMATSGTRTADAMESITIQRFYYHYYLDHFSSILSLLTMHFFALSISGILHRYLIWPASMIWPKTLMSCSLIRTLTHTDQTNSEQSQWTMARFRFFRWVVLLQFIWYWFPGYIFPLLSFFSLVCMIAPKNLIFSQITGANGLGLGAFEFDWNAWVAYIDSPILVPFWAHVNIFFGFAIVMWFTVPIFYYANIWESKKMPIIANRVFDINGYFYNPGKILDDNYRLNQTAYQSYGEVYITAGFAVSYGFTFAGISALIVHTALYYGKSIVQQYRTDLSDKKNDIHAKLMSYYPTVPEWWYYIMLLFTLAIALIFCSYTQIMSPALVLLSVILLFILAIPNGIIIAITSMSFPVSGVSDVTSGLVLAGNPIGVLLFRTYSFVCQSQIMIYLTSFKIGHYMKIPPRVLFPLLILSAIISSTVHYITGLYLLKHVENICTRQNPLWKCLSVENTYTTSIIFGVAGSFNPGSKYFPVLLAFPLGIVFPVISWCLWKRFPNIKWLALINFPLILLTTCNLPPAPAAEFPSWFIVGFIFNFVIYRYAHQWWQKYAYIFSAAMSCGVAICGFLIFFILENYGITFPQWWGTGGITGDGCPLASANYSGIIPTEQDL